MSARQGRACDRWHSVTLGVNDSELSTLAGLTRSPAGPDVQMAPKGARALLCEGQLSGDVEVEDVGVRRFGFAQGGGEDLVG